MMWLLFVTFAFTAKLLSLGVEAAGTLQLLGTSSLGPDPQTVNRLNGESFQQDPLVSFNGYQYAVFWTPDSVNASVRHVTVSRRELKGNLAWESFTLADYNQTADDGHSMFVS